MSSTTADLPLPRDSAQRQHRLAASVRGLRTRVGGTDQARLLLAGGVLIPLGIVLILLGWQGASQTVHLFEQIPYAISGGMLGLALVFAGGFCYFAYWLTELVYATRRDTADTRAVLERIEALLASNASLAATPARRQLTATTYLATATGTMFHRPDCPVVAGRAGLREVTGDEEGLSPCRICQAG